MVSSVKKHKQKQDLYVFRDMSDWQEILKFFYEDKVWRRKRAEYEWIFRGDNPAPPIVPRSHIPKKAFRSSLEKAFEEFGIKGKHKRKKIEQRLIREFRRKVFLHTNYKPVNWLECLALMQHYGAPTRLLDWTYSFFVAVYFGIARAHKGSSVVWALNSNWLATKCKRVDEEKIAKIPKLSGKDTTDISNKVVHDLITDNPESLIYAANPYSMNERLTVQRGVFLCPGNLSDKSWGENLEDMLKTDQTRDCLWRISIHWKDAKRRREILRNLHEMNISQASLFPDLGGFAESLRTRIAHPESLGIR